VTDGKTAPKASKKYNENLWDLISRNIEWVNYASLSNSLLILQVLDEAERPLSAGEISARISSNTKGLVYKVSATIRDSIEHRLMREGLVEGIEMESRTTDSRKVRTLHFTMTAKGKHLLKGWTAFVRAYS
jgi:DNA-binding PadR family transcriptional regulator